MAGMHTENTAFVYDGTKFSYDVDRGATGAYVKMVMTQGEFPADASFKLNIHLMNPRMLQDISWFFRGLAEATQTLADEMLPNGNR